MKKFLFLFLFTFVCSYIVNANVLEVNDPIILTEKFDNPIGGQGLIVVIDKFYETCY